MLSQIKNKTLINPHETTTIYYQYEMVKHTVRRIVYLVTI